MIKNPTTEKRHEILRKLLKSLQREDDFEYIVQLASPPPNIQTIGSKKHCYGKRVGVIGGGSAGLAAAYELRKLGFDITLLEAEKERIGGRIHTYYFSDKLYGELGGMVIPASHETLWHYINTFNLDTNSLITVSENNIVFVKNVRIQGIDTDEQIRKMIFSKFNLTEQEKQLTLTQLIEYVYNQQLLPLTSQMRSYLFRCEHNYPDIINFFDHISLLQALERLGLSRGAIDLYNCISGLDRGLFNISYLELLRQTYAGHFVEGFEISKGMANLPRAFYRSLTKPDSDLGEVHLKMGCKVSDIYYDFSNSKIKLKYYNSFSEESLIENFDYVISAIPFSQLRLINIYPLLSNEKMFAIRELNYRESQKTILLCNERFWERKINDQIITGGSTVTDLPITTCWYPSIRYDDQYGVMIASYNIELDAHRLDNIDDCQRIEIMKRQLEKVHGLPKNYLDKVVVDFKTTQWYRNPNFLGAFCLVTPEQNRLFAYDSSTPEYHNRMFFAGEHTSMFHGWIQGALQSGMRAANEVARMCVLRAE